MMLGRLIGNFLAVKYHLDRVAPLLDIDGIFEPGETFISVMPAPSCVDGFFELEPFPHWNLDRKLDIFPVQIMENFLLEKSRVHSNFNPDSRHLLSDLGYAIFDDVQRSAFGIVDIA